MSRFTLKGRLQLDGSQWKSGLAQASRDADQWSAGVASRVRSRFLRIAASSALLFGIDRKAAEAGRVRDESTALGIDPETFQKIDFAARQSGASVDDAARAIKRLGTSSIDALRGSKEVMEAYQRFGITADTLNRLKAEPDSLLFLLSELVEKGVNPTALADLQKIAGRSAPNLIAAFKEGFAGSGAEAERLGVISSNEEILKLAAFGDTLTTQKARVDRAFTGALSAALDAPEAFRTEAEILKTSAGSAMLHIQELQLRAQLEMKKSARESAENTRVLNGS